MKFKTLLLWALLIVCLSAIPACDSICGGDDSPYSPPSEEAP